MVTSKINKHDGTLLGERRNFDVDFDGDVAAATVSKATSTGTDGRQMKR